ncbi:MAG TPA: hypothetical protein VE913_15605 [Longimicrobium sp.]|nr:hypothetical protein [Longimicrobium sp.]
MKNKETGWQTSLSMKQIRAEYIIAGVGIAEWAEDGFRFEHVTSAGRCPEEEQILRNRK